MEETLRISNDSKYILNLFLDFAAVSRSLLLRRKPAQTSTMLIWNPLNLFALEKVSHSYSKWISLLQVLCRCSDIAMSLPQWS